MHYTTSLLMTPNRQPPLKGKPLNSTIMRSRKHYITDHMTESSAAYQIKRHMKYSKKCMTACVEFIILVWRLEIDSEGWGFIGQRWSLTLSLTPSDVTPVRSMVTSSTRHQDIFTLQLLPGHSRCGGWTWLALSAHLLQKDIDLS